MYAFDPDRTAFLAARAVKGNVTVPAWPRMDKDLPLVEVEAGWLRFSTLNHRTRAEQLQEIHAAGKSDLFTLDPLGPEAQSIQYRILCRQEGFEALREDLRERGQQEPAIVTADGILINGNRRSAAMRSLLDNGFLKAKYVKCLVLPNDATMDELVDLEAELQVARDFKQDYSWINEAWLIEELYDREGKNWDRVAERMHRRPGDVRDLYEKLQQVHQLVELSRGARLHVDFNDNESAFDELAKHIRNKSPQEADAVRAVYLLGTLAGTQYRSLRHLRRPDAAEMVWQELSDDPALRPILEAADASATAVVADDPLDELLGEVGPASPLHNLLGFVATKRPEENVSLADGSKVLVQDMLGSLNSCITAVANESEEERRDHSTLYAPIKRADKAIEEMHRIIATLPKARAFPEWVEAELQERVFTMDKLLVEMKETS